MTDRIAKKRFQFTVWIRDVQFNSLGSFFLKLSVRSTFSSDYSAIWVKDLAISDRYVPGYYVTTDVVHQEDKTKFLQFHRNKFVFFLPKG